MNYQEFAERMRAVPCGTGFLYDWSVLWLHPENLPYGVVSLGKYDGTVFKPPRQVVNTRGMIKPVNAVAPQALHESGKITDFCFWDYLLSGIPGNLFSGCGSLKRITLSKGVKRISEGAFAGCTGLEDIYYEGGPGEWDKIEIVSRRHEIDFGKAIPGTPVLRIDSERYVSIPGNEPPMNATIHFGCDPRLCYDGYEKPHRLALIEHPGNSDPRYIDIGPDEPEDK
ncbi:MAG: leucine-rich repeat protein [Clostridia bacterium]|nr:leucine-rich repeat protein [Clostridia bacterium]